MPTIKPVSDLRNYPTVLEDVQVGKPVFLTKNGRGCYAIIDISDYERFAAELRLMYEIERGERSGREEGWLTIDEVDKE
jgi:prevent-host-death family protein